MNKLKYIVLILFSLSLISCGVTDDNDDDGNGNADGSAIAGKWGHTNGNVYEISGTGGIFYEVDSGSVWATAIDEGFIEIGDGKFRNISHQSDNEWAVQELWFKPEGNQPAAISWSSTGKIELSGNGQSITITTANPFPPGNTSSYTLNRVD